MKIKSSHESQGPFVLINDEDFDPLTMEEFAPDAPPDDAADAPKKRGRPAKSEVTE